MIEEYEEENERKILHIYAPPYKIESIRHRISEFFYDFEKSRSKFKFPIKFEKFRKFFERVSHLHKIPHSFSEHTEFDKYPYVTTCPNCLSYIKTEIHRHTTGATRAISAAFVPICMCMIPYITTKYKDVVHYCPRCKIYLGVKFGRGKILFGRFIVPIC